MIQIVRRFNLVRAAAGRAAALIEDLGQKLTVQALIELEARLPEALDLEGEILMNNAQMSLREFTSALKGVDQAFGRLAAFAERIDVDSTTNA